MAEIQPPAAKAPPPMEPAAHKVKLPPEQAALKSRESVWHLRRALPRSWRLPLSLVLPSLILLLWCALTLGKHPAVNGLFLPSPLEILRYVLNQLLNGGARSWAADVWASALRIAISFAAAALLALPLGVLMGSFEPVNRIVEPVMAPLRYMPISAFIPLLILWLGIGESQKIAFLFLGVFVFLLPVVVTAIRAVPEELVQTALTLGASRFQAVMSVLLPAALPDIFDSFRVMNAISWTYVVLAEFVNARSGIGYRIQLAGTHLHTVEVFVGIAVIGLIGLGTDALIRALNGFLFRWRESDPS
jgi:NitT/TauT family transport system permease protein